MKNHHVTLITNIAASLAAAGAFLTLMATPVLARHSGTVLMLTPGQRRDPAIDRMNEMKQREALLRRGAGAKPGEPADKRQIEAVLAQMGKDFKRIQIIRNEIVHDISANKTLDYRRISEATAEVKKRASQLKAYLALYNPENNENNQPKFNDERIRDALVMLCNRIISFVTNSIFENPDVVDIQQSAKASRDLQSIIELSGSIRKSAERLNKARDYSTP